MQQRARLNTEPVTVVTLTRERNDLLQRAINSVRLQDYAGSIDHVIVIDDCSHTADYLANCESHLARRVIAHLEPRSADDHHDENRSKMESVYPRIARLLNIGIRKANSRWIAFLDDDNEYETNHVRTLVQCAVENTCAAVHSFRKILHADGSPYLTPRFPWTRDPDEAARVYELLCSRGVWVRNSNILKDRAGPSGLTPFRNSTIMTSRDPVFLVDTSVWLLDRDLLLTFPIPEIFSEEDFRLNTAPDDKFLELLLDNQVRIVSSGLPTLKYYLGGISN